MLSEGVIKAQYLYLPAMFTSEFIDGSGALAARFLNPADAEQLWKQDYDGGGPRSTGRRRHESFTLCGARFEGPEWIIASTPLS